MRSGTSPAHCGCRVKGAAVFCHLSKFSKFVMEVITDFMTRGQKAREKPSQKLRTFVQSEKERQTATTDIN